MKQHKRKQISKRHDKKREINKDKEWKNWSSRLGYKWIQKNNHFLCRIHKQKLKNISHTHQVPSKLNPYSSLNFSNNFSNNIHISTSHHHASNLDKVNHKGKNRYNLKRTFKKVLERAGIKDFRFHDLRHTFATRLVQKGEDIYKVAMLMGHRDIRITQRHSHHCPESLRSGVEILVNQGLKWLRFGYGREKNGFSGGANLS